MVIKLTNPYGIRLLTKGMILNEDIFIIPASNYAVSDAAMLWESYTFNDNIVSDGAVNAEDIEDMNVIVLNSVKGIITLDGTPKVCYVTPIIVDGKLQVRVTDKMGNSSIIYSEGEINNLSGVQIELESEGMFDNWFDSNTTHTK